MKEKNKNEYLKNPDSLSEIHNIEKKNNLNLYFFR